MSPHTALLLVLAAGLAGIVFGFHLDRSGRPARLAYLERLTRALADRHNRAHAVLLGSDRAGRTDAQKIEAASGLLADGLAELLAETREPPTPPHGQI
ncbi:hypothetical protein GCM10022221_68300 [Actinocorallia aurea]